ncbi:MAG: ComF family protein [Armatimonadetes bacterium]|nr:ComF family protein [Armatimonadota bacterium]
MHDSVRRLWDGIIGLVYPSQCTLCYRIGEEALCPSCHDEMVVNGSGHIQLPQDSPLSFAECTYHYSGRAEQAVCDLKFQRRTALGRPLAQIVREEIDGRGMLDFADWIVPVPIHWRRWCYRGFNQSELLCELLPRDRVQIEVLKRIRHTKPQYQLSPSEREINLTGAFASGELVGGKNILLVDDIYTSGATATECAKALIAGGAASVGVYALTSGGALLP